MPKLNILDVGSGPDSVARTVFDEHENELTVVRMDADPEVHPDYVQSITETFPSELHDRFDIVFCAHVLEHIERQGVIPAMQHLASAVKPGGELWIIVPSLEFVANDIYLRGGLHPGIQPMLYGSQENEYQYHKCGFTLVNLRQLVAAVGLVPRKAYHAPFTITFEKGEDAVALQNICIGMKDVATADPALAID